MTEDEWVKNRILWKANRRCMLEKREEWRGGEKLPEQYCALFHEIDDAKKQLLNNMIGKVHCPVLVFWCNEDLWTVLGTRDIWSYYGEKLHHAKLDEIDGGISLVKPGGVRDEYVKFEASFLRLNKVGIDIWASKAPEYFALWSILRMFPIRRVDV